MTQNTYKYLIDRSTHIYMNLRSVAERLKNLTTKKVLDENLIGFINSKSDHNLKFSKEIARMFVSNLDIGIGSLNDHSFKLNYTLVEQDLESLYKDTSELSDSLGFFEDKWYKKLKTNDPFVRSQIEKDLLSNSILVMTVNESLLKTHAMLTIEMNSHELTIEDVQKMQENISINKKIGV